MVGTSKTWVGAIPVSFGAALLFLLASWLWLVEVAKENGAETRWWTHVNGKPLRSLPSGWVDVTVPITSTLPVFDKEDEEGLGAGHRTLSKAIAKGGSDYANVSKLQNFSVHSGTHVDSPGHFIESAYQSGRGVESLSLDVLIGPCLVLFIPHGQVSAAVLEKQNIPAGTDRLVLKTSNTARKLWETPKFFRDYAGLTADGAAWLVEKGIRLVGIDYLSVCSYEQIVECHVALLRENVHIVEGLDLTEISEGIWNILALPMKISGSDGALARVLMSQGG